MGPLNNATLFLYMLLLTGLGMSQNEESFSFQEEKIVATDAVELMADIYLPAGEGPFPVIYWTSPYGIRNRHRQHFSDFLRQNGYAVVMQNMRGKHGSGGRFSPFLRELEDLDVVLHWILKQEWCSGSIGIYGSSSSSYSGQHLASTGHPAIKALVNVSGLTSTRQLFFPGGAFRLNTLYPWLTYFYKENRIPRDQWDQRFRQLPVSSGFDWEPVLLRQMAAGNVNIAGIQAPVLHITGWNDVVYRHSMMLHQGIQHFRNGSVSQKLIVGPWEHNYDGENTVSGTEDFGPASRFSVEAERQTILEWFDQHVKGRAAHHEQSPVRVFIMSLNEWREYDQWPPQEAQETIFYLSPQQEETLANQQGSLKIVPPAVENRLTFTYDPHNPVPTDGGVNSHIFPKTAGPRDQSRFAARPDVLFFASPALKKPLTVVGRMRVTLFAASTAPDTDFTAKLVAVRPSGEHRIIEDGIIRASYRHGGDIPRPIVPGEVVQYEIDLGWSAVQLASGERLGLHVSSSNFPKYDRNPNNGQDALLASDMQSAEQTIYFSRRYPSQISLSVLPHGE